MSWLTAALLVAAVICQHSDAAPVAPKCRPGCPNSAGKTGQLHYEAGNVYKYDFDSEIVVFLSGADATQTKVHVHGLAEIYTSGGCKYAVRLLDVSIDGHDKASVADLQLDSAVAFSLAGDDTLVPEICVEDGAKVNEFGLNIKRAVISLFQSAQQKSHETDVFGTCPTTFSQSKTSAGIVVTKTRNLNACGHREILSNGLVTGIFDDNAGVTSTPLLNGDYTAEQTIDKGIIQHAVVNEAYTFVPLNSGEAGIRARATTNLKLKGTSKAALDTSKAIATRTLLFVNPETAPLKVIDDATLTSTFWNTYAQFKGKSDGSKVDSKAADHFTELIRLLRFTSKDKFLTFFNAINKGTLKVPDGLTEDKELSRSLYLDALFRTATSQSVQAIADLQVDFNEKERSQAYWSLNLVPSVDAATLPAVEKLLHPKAPRHAYLTVGNLVNKYCRKHGCETEINKISAKFINLLKPLTTAGTGKQNKKHIENVGVAVLKGIRNTNHLPDPKQVLELTNAKHSTRLRSQAIQTLAANPCHAAIQKAMLNQLQNREFDSEIRIEAYRTYVACPSGAVANAIKTLLDTETSQQVGSFITSHLAALRSSTDLYRESARHHFANIRAPAHRFPSDLRQYSFNHEYSYAVGSLGLGASVDASVIYSHDSFLPRTGRLNVTGALFGNNVNVFEVSGRQENLERIMERNFGPKGLFNTKTPQELYDKFHDVTAIRPEESQDAIGDLSLDVSVKFFGSEMYFMSLGDNIPSDPDVFVATAKRLGSKVFTSAKGFDELFECRSLIVDAELVYPTAAGFPLKLSAYGAGAGRLKANGKFDLAEIRKNPKSTAFNFNLEPSYSVQLTGSLTVDGFVTSTGYRITGSLHSSTGMEIDFKLLADGRRFETKFNMPVTQQRLFTAEHNIQQETRDRGRAAVLKDVKFTTKPDIHTGCFDQLEKLTGVTVCGTLLTSVPAANSGVAPFPLTGPNKIEAFLEVAPKYSLNAEYIDSTPNVKVIKVEFDTPGSADARKADASLELSTKEGAMYVRAIATAGSESLTAEVGFTNSQTAMEVYGSYKTTANNYRASVGFKKSGDARLTTYTPSMELVKGGRDHPTTENNINGYQLTGTMTVAATADGGHKIAFNNIQFIGKNFDPVQLNGDIGITKERKVATNLKLSQKDKRIESKGEFHFVSLREVLFDLSGTCNVLEYANGRVRFDLKRTDELFKNDISLVYGKDPESTKNRIDLKQKYEYKVENKALTHLKIDFELVAPFIDSKAELDAEYQPNAIEYDFKVKIKRHTLESNMKAKLNAHHTGDYDVKAEAALNKHNIKVEVKREVGDGRSKVHNTVSSSFGTKIKVDGDFAHLVNSQSADINFNGVILLAEKEPELTFTFVLKAATKSVVTNGNLSIDKKALIEYDVKIDRDDTTKSAKFSVKLSDTAAADGSATSKNGKGDGSVLINLPNMDRKIKLTSEFNVAAPIYDAHYEFFYDFEKDNAKKITLDTKNVIGAEKKDSTNTLDICGEKFVLVVATEGAAGSVDGRYHGKVDLTLPTQRRLSGEYKREAHHSNDGTVNRRIDAKLSDTMANKKERSVSANLNYNVDSDVSKAKKGFNFVSSITISDFDGRTALLTNEFKNEPVGGHFHTASALMTVKGTLLKEVIDVQIVADEYCSEHAVYHASAKYGGHVTASVKGNYYLNHGSKPYSYDVTTEMALPQSDYKQLRFTSSGKFAKPAKEDGVYEGEFKVGGKANDKVISMDTAFKGNAKQGSTSLKLNIPEASPFSLDTTYGQTGDEDHEDRRGTVEVRFGNGKTVKGSGAIKVDGHNSVAIEATLITPYDNAKNIDFAYKWAKSNENQYDVLLAATVDDNKYKATSALVVSDTQPSLNIAIDYPNRKQLQFHAAVQNVGDRRHRVELKLLNAGDFNFDGKAEASYQSLDTFRLEADVDSAKLKLNKVHVDVAAKPSSAGRGLDFKVLSDDKNVVSGSVQYTVGNDGLVYTGEGNIKWFDQQKKATFKLTKNGGEKKSTDLTDESIVFTAHVGDVQKLSFTLVRNRNTFRLATSMCEENNKCYVIEVKSVYEPEKLSHELLILVDLLQVGLDKEFRLQAVTSRRAGAFTHNHDIRLKSKDNTLYMYKVKIDQSAASVELILPKRTLALESVYRIPKNEIFGHYEVTVSSFLDKQNHPNSKASAGFTGDLERTGAAYKASGELKFSHPTVKEMRIAGNTDFDTSKATVSGQLKLDIFRQPNQAIVLAGNVGNSEGSSFEYKDFNITGTLALRSTGLGLDYGFDGHAAISNGLSFGASVRAPTTDLRAGIFVAASIDRIDVVVSGFNEELLRIDGAYDKTTDSRKAKATLTMLGARPVVADASLSNGWRSLKANVVRDNLLALNGEATFGKVLSIKLNGPDGKSIYTGTMALDAAHFLSSEYKVNQEDFKKFVKSAQQQLKTDAENAKKELSGRFEKVHTALKDQGESIKKALPDFTKFAVTYKDEAKKLGDEMLEDKTIKEIYDFFHRFYGTIGKTISEIVNVIVEHVKKTHELIAELYTKTLNAFNDRLLPALKESWSQIELTVSALYEETLSLAMSAAEQVIAVLKTFEKDFAKLGKAFSEYIKRIADLLDRWTATARKELTEIAKILEDTLNELPGWDYFKTKLQAIFGDRFSTANLVNAMNTGATVLAELLPTSESKNFVEQLRGYVEKKLKSTKVNDIEELKKIYSTLVSAVQSLITYARSEFSKNGISFSGGDVYKPLAFSPIPFSIDALKRIPYLASFKLSAWNYLRNEPTPSIRDFLYTYRPYAFNPLNFLPPFEKHAQIADGQHIFTFDGRHITFPGSCQYTLAEDTLNSNFTIIARLAGGKLKSITLSDRSDNKVELSANGAIKSKAGTAEDLPYHADDIHAWRDYYSVTILTRYGAHVTCTLDLTVCSVTVNGYYHGRLRGILGNANAEEFDDFTVRDGKITDSSATFCNSFKAETSCADTPQDDHSHHQGTDACAEHFAGGSSTLRHCFYFIRPDKYREACEHAVAHADTVAAKQELACTIARAYTLACRAEHIPVTVSDACTRCDGGDVAVGHSSTVTVPQNMADIVMVLDTESVAKETLMPALNKALRSELRTRGITDVHIAVIGFNADRKYFSHFTNGGKLDVGDKTHYDSAGPTKYKPITTTNADFNTYLETVYRHAKRIESDLHMSSDGQAFREALSYPFRSGASRVIIAVRADPLSHSTNPAKQIAGVAVNKLVKNAGITLHLIEPIPELKSSGGPAGTVVGFNSKVHIALPPNGKKQVSTYEQRQKLTYTDDLGIELVLAVDGYAFNSAYYATAKDADKKRFVGVVTTSIAEQLSRNEVTSDCKCEATNSISAHQSCTVKETRLRPPVVRKPGARG